MRLDASLAEAYSVLQSLFEDYKRDVKSAESSGHQLLITRSQTFTPTGVTREQLSRITPQVQLLPREPQGNGNDCSAAASRSATEAIRQASQSASEAVRQASQSASQAVQQATISATNAIRDAQNSASQSVAQASRSSSSISSSASSAVSSMQSSADQAVASARNEARRLMSQASAAIDAATGSNAAAASSLLSPTNQATACPNNNGNNPIISSTTVAITPKQAALAIVGSIFASTLLTFIFYYLFRRYRRNAAARKKLKLTKEHQYSSRRGSWPPPRSNSFDSSQLGNDIAIERKMPPFEQIIPRSSRDHQSPFEVASQSRNAAKPSTSGVSLSLFPRTPTSAGPPITIKQTEVAWDPTAPQLVPKLGNWLKIQRPLSPFGSIKLPIQDKNSNLPLGGQLKSPLIRTNNPAPVKTERGSDLPFRSSSVQQKQQQQQESSTEAASTSRLRSLPDRYAAPPTPAPVSTASKQAVSRLRSRSQNRQPQGPKRRSVADFIETPTKERYREVKASVWQDDSASSSSNFSTAAKAKPKSKPEERGRSTDREIATSERRKEMASRGNWENIKKTEVEWDANDEEEKRLKEEVMTPDTGIVRSVKVGTAVRGRVLVPSMIGERKIVGGSSRLAVEREA